MATRTNPDAEPEPEEGQEQSLTLRERARRLDAWAAGLPGWRRGLYALLLCVVPPLLFPPFPAGFMAAAVGLFLVATGAWTYLLPAALVSITTALVTGLWSPTGGPLGIVGGLAAGWLAFVPHGPDADQPAEPTSPAAAGDAGTEGHVGADQGEPTVQLPPADLLQRTPPAAAATAAGQLVLDTGRGPAGEAAERAQALAAKLEEIKVGAHVVDWIRGPSVTRIAVELDAATKVSVFEGYTKDIAVTLGTPDVRLVVPIPGRSAIGVEVPNLERDVVLLGDLLALMRPELPPLMVPFGCGLDGEPVLLDLAELVHLLLAGTTGSGKSVLLNAIITALLMRNAPDRLRLLLIDPARVELVQYDGVPHLLEPVVTDPIVALEALGRLETEMQRRLDLLAGVRARNITAYNQTAARAGRPQLPYVIAVIDELAQLPTAAMEAVLARLAGMARKTGIHLVVATQRPSVDVVTGVIKANLPSRGALKVPQHQDSKTILDLVGAEKLTGQGDMLLRPDGASTPIRVQGAYVTDEEVAAVVRYCRDRQAPAVPGWTVTASPDQPPPVGEAGHDAERRELAVESFTAIHEWADRHADRLVVGIIKGDPIADGKLGHRRDDGSLALLPDPVKVELVNLGFDPEEVLRAWVHHGLMSRGEAGNLLPKVYFGPVQRSRRRLIVLSTRTTIGAR